jgi:hypothetical protein
VSNSRTNYREFTKKGSKRTRISELPEIKKWEIVEINGENAGGVWSWKPKAVGGNREFKELVRRGQPITDAGEYKCFPAGRWEEIVRDRWFIRKSQRFE